MPSSHADRSRPRAEHSSRLPRLPRPAKDAGTSRLPSAPRERRPVLAALAVLLIVGGALLAGLLANRMDHRTEMLAAAGTIEAGQVIAIDDLVSVRVSADVANLIPAAEAQNVVGRTARVEIAEGQLLDSSQLAAEDLPGADAHIVGVALDAGRFPAGGLRPGDVVDVVNVSSQAVSVSDAQVLDAVPSSGTDGDWSSGAIISLMVGPRDAAALAASAASGDIAVVVTAVGQPIGDD